MMSSHSLWRARLPRGCEIQPAIKPRSSNGEECFLKGKCLTDPGMRVPSQRPTVAPVPARSLENSMGIKAGAQYVLEPHMEAI